jgi:hypothetical protein
MRDALEGRGSVTVALYVLAQPDSNGIDHPRFEVANGAAEANGWSVGPRYLDVTGDTDPGVRPQWAMVHKALADGEIDGVVAASQTDISTHDEWYRQQLLLLRDRGGFLGLARPEAAL